MLNVRDLMFPMGKLEKIRFLLACVYVGSLPVLHLFKKLYGMESVFKPYRIAGIILGLFFAIAIASGKRRFRIDIYDACFVALFSWGFAVGIMWNILNGVDIAAMINAGTLISFSLSLAWIIKREEYDYRHVKLFISIYVSVSFLSIVFWVTKDYSLLFTRFSASYQNPNSLGFSAGFSILYLIVFVFLERSGGLLKRALAIAVITVFTVALLSSGSRGSTIGMLAGMFAIGASIAISRSISAGVLFRAFLSALAFGSLIGAGLYFALDSSNKDVDFVIRNRSMRFTGGEGHNKDVSSGRFDIWRSAISVAANHGFVGVGTGQYKQYHRKYILQIGSGTKLSKRKMVVHSTFIALLVNEGIVGFFLYLFVIISLGTSLKRQFRNGRNDSILIFFTAGFTLILFSQLTANSFLTPETFLFLYMTMIVIKKPGPLLVPASSTVPT